MGFFGAAFKALKQVMTGEVVQEISTLANGSYTTMSLRLKRNRKSNEYYVVLAALSRGNSQYFSFTKDEFDIFSNAVEIIRRASDQAIAQSKA